MVSGTGFFVLNIRESLVFSAAMVERNDKMLELLLWRNHLK